MGFVYFLLLLCSQVLPKHVDIVLQEKEMLLERELKMMLGSDIVLSDNEEKVNEIIMSLKNRELNEGFKGREAYNLSKHFFHYKDEVKKSPLFKIIQDMPKGAVLHAHDTGVLSPDYVLKITYADNLYVCFENDDIKFLFSKSLPSVPCLTTWQLMRDARYAYGSVKKFDANLRKHFTMVVDDPVQTYPDIHTAWKKFGGYFIKTGPLLSFKPIYEQYFYDTLKTFRSDNIMYIELRSVLPELYDLEGNKYDSVTVAETYKKVLDQFMEDYPDFYGAKLIYAPLRHVDEAAVMNYMNIAKKINEKLPNFLAGFDLVGQEDLGQPIKEFMPTLAANADDLNYFFHAGETNWCGMTTDENLFDAILLGAKRLGHAYSITKHPVLIEEVVKRDIGLEINVISNTVLKLVEDVRNHPLASYLALGLPVIISSDDPGVWEAEPLSHDFYVAFVGVASRHADLKMLKKLALNSLYYSTIPNKDKALYEFEIRWTKFIDRFRKYCTNAACEENNIHDEN